MTQNPPRIVLGALKGSSGKTLLSLGLISAWREAGHDVAPFKKGPDFIDAGWLSFAAARQCHNLDTFLMDSHEVRDSFLSNSDGADVSVIEGNRGLYDGLDVEGRCSTAELAKLLGAPVLLVVEVSMATRTVAALIKGCQGFDPDLKIAGIVLNRVAGPRQEALVAKAVEKYCRIPVLGSVPKLKGQPFPERHMGLVPFQERSKAEKAVLWAEKTVERHLHLHEIFEIAKRAAPLPFLRKEVERDGAAYPPREPPRIGVIRDKAFWFYYPENLEQLKSLGATLVEIDAFTQSSLPRLDALYIGGGFPETQAQGLADNQGFREALRQEIEKGLPVYAECGGLMYLGEDLFVNGKFYPMVGALPVRFILQERPEGHGYTVLKVTENNPFFPVGVVLKGHEFHYSKPDVTDTRPFRFAFTVSRGQGVDGRRDGFCKGNLLATYTHIHARGNPMWAEGLVKAALRRQTDREKKNSAKAEKKD